MMRSTRPRIGCLEVGKLASSRQSNTDFTGLISRRIVRSTRSTDLLAARGEIRVRILLEQHDDVGERAALLREMAMRIELDADHAVRSDQRAHPLEEVAFAVVIAVRHHRAVQVEHRAVDRQRGLQLAEDFVAHPLIGGARGRAARLRRVAGALDQLEFAALRARPHRVHRAGLVRAARGILSGRKVELLDEGLIRGRQRQEGVRLERERGVEQTQKLSLSRSVSLSRLRFHTAP